MADLAERARTRKLSADDVVGRDLHDHEPGPVRHVHDGADHQPAPGGDPLDRRHQAAAGRDHRAGRDRGRSASTRSACWRSPSTTAPSTAPTRRRSCTSWPGRSRRATGRPSFEAAPGASCTSAGSGASATGTRTPAAGAVQAASERVPAPARAPARLHPRCAGQARARPRRPGVGRGGARAGRPGRRRHLSRSRPARRLPDPRRRHRASARCPATCTRIEQLVIDALGDLGLERCGPARGLPGRLDRPGRAGAEEDLRHRREDRPRAVHARLRPQRRPRPRHVRPHRPLRDRRSRRSPRWRPRASTSTMREVVEADRAARAPVSSCRARPSSARTRPGGRASPGSRAPAAGLGRGCRAAPSGRSIAASSTPGVDPARGVAISSRKPEWRAGSGQDRAGDDPSSARRCASSTSSRSARRPAARTSSSAGRTAPPRS